MITINRVTGTAGIGTRIRCMFPCGRFCDGKNQRGDIAGNIPADQVIPKNRICPRPLREQGWHERGFTSAETGFLLDYNSTQNTSYLPQGMPTRRGQSPRERQDGVVS